MPSQIGSDEPPASVVFKRTDHAFIIRQKDASNGNATVLKKSRPSVVCPDRCGSGRPATC